MYKKIDDRLILIIGRVLNTMCEIIHRLLQGVESGAQPYMHVINHVHVNPIMTVLMLFTRK